MIRTYRFQRRAEIDIQKAFLWYREQSLAAARKWQQTIKAAVESPRTTADRHPLAAESTLLNVDIQELAVGKGNSTYRILYVKNDVLVTVIRLLHASRDELTEFDLELP